VRLQTATDETDGRWRTFRQRLRPWSLIIQSMGDSVPLMKAVLAALLLLFQLQPALGTVACLSASERAPGHECKMPEHGQAPTPMTAIAASGTAAQHCELAAVCTPAPPAIPALSVTLETAVSPFEAAGPLAATRLLGLPPAPPFHPPRA
jgi:hypothetical protein